MVGIQRRCSFLQMETKAPDDSAGRTGECEGNEMENTNKLETWPRGGEKEWKALEQGDMSLKGWSREAQSSCSSEPHCQKERAIQGAAAASDLGGLSQGPAGTVLCKDNLQTQAPQ